MDYKTLFSEKRKEIEHQKKMKEEENKIADNNLRNSAPHLYQHVIKSVLNNFEKGNYIVRFACDSYYDPESIYYTTNHPNTARLREYSYQEKNQLCKKIAYDLKQHFSELKFSCIDANNDTYGKLEISWNPKDF